ncbi:MAG: S9 family peptidase [Candidatus Eremiobacteraeota bacterium]|nr:S9 family peptidase [Candidatus Eremiobacteraeota bacterium]
MQRFVCAATCCALIFATLPYPAQAAPPNASAIYDAMQSVVAFDSVAVSPDGTRVAWQQTVHHHPTVWIESLATHARVRVSADVANKDADEGDVAWSPDSKRLAFLSNARTKGPAQLFIADAGGSRVAQLGTLTGAAQELTWSPNGEHIGLLYIARPHRKSGALAAGARDVGVIGSSYDEQQIATVDVRSGALRVITPATDYVYEYAWAPDSSRFAFTYARGSGDDNWWIAKLATVPSAGGPIGNVLSPSYQINAPTWSPDGRSIAVIGGIMSDFGSVGGDVYRVDLATNTASDITPGMEYSASSLRWVAPSRIMMLAHHNGSRLFTSLDPKTGTVTPLAGNGENLTGLSVSKNGDVVAMVRQSFTQPPELWAGAPHALAQITNVNAHVPQFCGRAVSLTWKSDAYDVQGWLIYPHDYRAGRKYPMVTIVHGGPSAESLPSYASLFISPLAANGYFVFEPNPRGSFGRGEAFAAANVKDFGGGDWRDDLAGVDAAIAAAPIDGNRLGLAGWSYGGYMAMWGETQTARFKAIVAGAGLVNWQSYYGQNKIDQWMIPFFGASVYDDPAVYAKSSPITYIKQSKTPVLVLAGERDEEVPAAQSFEFAHAMQALGVPSQLVVYADEGHGVRQPGHVRDIISRMVAWFDKYLH